MLRQCEQLPCFRHSQLAQTGKAITGQTFTSRFPPSLYKK